MNNLSKGYALALFMAAKEEDMRHEYFEALKLTDSVLGENPEYMNFLSSPRITSKERRAALLEAFLEHIPMNVINFMCLLSDEKNVPLLGECIEEYRALMLREEKTSEALVSSAVELTDGEKQRLQEKLEKLSGNKVIATYVTDESLLGGIKIELDGKIMDGSIRGRLKEIKEVMER